MADQTEPKKWRIGDKGFTHNPGGRPKHVKLLRALFKEDVAEAREMALRFMRDENEDSRVRMDAVKLILAYGLGAPSKFDPLADDGAARASIAKVFTVEQLQNLARQSLAEGQAADEDDDDDSDETVN